MQNFYPNRFRPHLQAPIRLAGILFLLCFALSTVFAQHNPDDELQQATVSAPGIDEYGYYVQFYLPVSNTQGIDRWILNGKIAVETQPGIYNVFAYFSSRDKDDKEVNFRVSGYLGGRVRAYNGNAANNTWSGFLTTASGNQIRTDGGADMAEILARWYIPQSMLGTTKRFRIEVDIDGNNGAGRGPTGFKAYTLGPVTFSHPVPETGLNWSFSGDAGKLSLDYSYNTTIANDHYTIRHWLTGDPAKVTDQTNVNPSGSIDVAMGNTSLTQTFHTEIVGKDGRITYNRTQSFLMPAYVWPDQIQATYNDHNTITLAWDVPAATGSAGTDFIDGDDFDLERSTDPDFLTNTKTVVSYPYDPDRTRYEIEDDLTDLKGGSRVYYRLRRTKSASQWQWDEARKTDVLIDMNTSFAADTVRLDDSDGSPKAVISWEPFRGVWVAGTEFLLKKSNLTSGSAPETIKLTEAQARSGQYIDENIRYCNEFAYAAALTLGNGFDSPPETKIPGTVLAVEIGTIRDLDASKGYFPDRTELKWTVQGVFDQYVIKRRVYGSGAPFSQIGTVQGAATGDVQTDDSKGIPGVYYEYMVVGAVNCNNTTKYSRDTLFSVGFRSPTGTVYGRITYENGQAVSDVAVRMESADNSQLGQSVYLNGESESYLRVDSLQTPFEGEGFTVEAWVKPVHANPRDQVIFSQADRFELGFDASGQLYFRFRNEQVAGTYSNPNQSFIHLAGIYARDSLGLMVNDSLLAMIPCPPQPTGVTDTTVFIGRNDAGNHFKGFIDEMRVWTRAMDPQRIARDYTRLMAGHEAGLAAYWRFDETIDHEFYDVSNTQSNYHKNDGIIGLQAFHSQEIPGPDQLALKAYTDATGNYMISGVPYIGNGTTYTIVPLLGTHQFDPTAVNRLISSNSSEFTVNFVDKSSFPVSGYVYYQNTTVPVKGVQFLIDGKHAQKENGQIIETDALGKFTISVPVGVHEVQAVKSNHRFVNEGKITDRFGNNLNYQAPVSERILHDSTTVRFIGRVAGGVIQSDFPLGHSLSRNNLGEKLTITMELAGAQNRKLNATSNDSTVVIPHETSASPVDPVNAHRTRVQFQEYAITIFPDSITGEFAVDLIPEDFNVTSVNATGHSSLNLPASLPLNINLTNKYFIDSQVYAYRDSVLKADDTWDYTSYSDTVFYNYAYKFIERNKPVIDVRQVTPAGNPVPYFGDTLTQVAMLNNQGYDVPVYNSADGSYLFGYPVFEQNKTYRFKVSAYELYEYFEEGMPGAPARTDQVPTQDGLVSVANELRSGSNVPDTLSLDKRGEGIYQFQAGEPEISNGIGRKGLSVAVDIAGQTIPWNNGNKLQAYVMGWQKTGTDFVTAGPNEIVRVLRDPPGSNSYAWFEEGTSTIVEKEYVGSLIQAGSEELKNSLGAATVTFVGLGGGTINIVEAGNTYAGKISHSEQFTGKDKTTTVTQFLTRYQTSADPTRVGAEADLFIGNSTNFTYGSTLELLVVKNEEVKTGSDLVFFDGAANGTNYSIVRRVGINIAQKFGTHFVYTAKHIEDILIPSIIDIRNSLLLPPSTSPETAQQRANSLEEEVYVSKLAADHPNYGASNVDVEAFGPAVLTAPWGDGPSYTIYIPDLPDFNQTDTILSLNQHIAGWKRELSENERMKVSESKLVKNFSFTGGGDVQYTEQAEIAESLTRNFNITIGASFLSSIGVKVNKTGMTLNIEEGLSTEHGGNFNNTETDQKSFGFVLSENSVDYLSVDVLKAPDSTFVFKTKGGETACPYEGPTLTKYYQPGTTIDQPTVRAEAPDITVDKPVLTDIPSTRNATFTLQLQNASETERGVSFFLQVMEDSNPDGAKIAMDGASLATGRAVWINPGQVLQKTITLERGPDVMAHEDIVLRLISECDTTAFDLVNISAHFIPSCSDIHIQSPGDNWLLNTQSPVNASGERYLPLVIDDFDVNNSLFGYIDLQYKPLAGSTWTSVVKFYADSTAFEEAQGAKAMITGSTIDYQLVMSDASFSDQHYEIRTVAVCMENGQQVSSTASNVIRGIKDTYRPRLFGSPQPANGVLGITDNVRLDLNETIAAGLLSYPDFQVTGIRNGSLGDHSVSVRLDGQNDYLATEFNKNLEGKDLTMEMWVLPSEQTGGGARGTLFSHGNINQFLELGFVPGNYLEVRVGESVVRSDVPIAYKPGEWAHVALIYDAAASTVSAVYNFVEVIRDVPVAPYAGSGHFEFGRRIGNQADHFKGALHEVRIWTENRPAIQLQTNSLVRLSGAEANLLAYYPMTEGKGDRVFDKAHGAHARLHGTWTTPPGKAVAFDGSAHLAIHTGASPITARMDYTMELWFKGEPGQEHAALASNGKGDGTDHQASASQFFLGFEDGLLTFRNHGVKVQAEGDFLDNDWHHVALAVNRNAGVIQLFVDGVLNTYADANGLGAIAAPYLYLGARGWYEDGAVTVSIDQHFKGMIDEFRLWNTYLNATLISATSNVRLKGDELGLLLYYPFETYVVFQNNKELAFSLNDQKIQSDPAVVIPPAESVQVQESDDEAPVKDRGPVDNLRFDYVVNDDALIINLLEPRQAIDQTLVTFRVENLRDMNGNTIESPITWTAYINRNHLSWSDDEFVLTQEQGETLEFESHILNSGGNVQNFRLDNVPPWIRVTPSSGTLAPQGSQKVLFQVNRGLNVGTYDDIVYMRNDDDETQALPIRLTVTGQEPDWHVDPADFDYSMIVYGKLRVNHIFSSNPNDLLAAFVGGKCVGVTRNVYNETNDLWYAFLTVYSHTLQHDDLEFRIWDAGSGKIYQAIPSQAVSFKNDAIVGTASNPVLFEGREMIYQNIPLNQGWNWISFQLASPGMGDVQTLLSQGQWQAGDIVKNEELGFHQYSASDGWVGYLESFNNTSLFMLRTANAQSLSLSGVPLDIAATPISVRGGRWNYISYLPLTNMTVAEALAGYDASDEDVIKSQTGFAMYSSQTGWVGNLNYLEPGKGYMLYRKAAQDETFYYPSYGGILSQAGAGSDVETIRFRSSSGGDTQSLNPFQIPVENHADFAGNMTVVAVLEDGFDFRPGDQVLAYVNGELRGKARAVINPENGRQQFFINIAGEEVAPVSIKIERQGAMVARSVTSINYQPDGTVGTLDQPLVIRVENEHAKITMYPNPFDKQLQISGEIRQSGAVGSPQGVSGIHTVQWLVYDVTGAKVAEGLPQRVRDDRFSLQWDGQTASGQECQPGVYFIHVLIDGRPLSGKVIKIDSPR